MTSIPTMTRKERARVVELLLCAVDEIMRRQGASVIDEIMRRQGTSVSPPLTVAVESLSASRRTEALAREAFYATPLSSADSTAIDAWARRFLEAAARVDLGEWP